MEKYSVTDETDETDEKRMENLLETQYISGCNGWNE